MHSLPRLVITGAGGFLGRYVMRAMQPRYRIIAIDRHARGETWLPPGSDVEWHQADIADAERVDHLFRRLARDGGADVLVHLAAYYDFSGEEHPEYWRTNVTGLRHVLDGSRVLGLRRFVFASSVAACDFPRPGEALTEDSVPDGDHLYARTKRIGEEMLAEYRGDFPSAIIRFAALFSDWCEYPPLYHFIGTWLSHRWNARVLGGRGESAIPYLHVRDAALCLRALLEKADELEPGEVLNASTDGAVSHRELFEAATREWFDGGARKPLFVPRPLCRPGMWIRQAYGDHFGEETFEKAWMADYVDLALTVDASRTRQRLGWEPRARLEILHRMPFLIENYRTETVEWHRRNQQMMALRRLHPNLQIYQLLKDHQEAIAARFAELLESDEAQQSMPSYQHIPEEERSWNHRLILRNLLHSVRVRRKGLFMAYCRDLAERRAALGFQASEVIYALSALHRACHDVLMAAAADRDLEEDVHDAVIQTVRFGADHVEMVYEALQGRAIDLPPHLVAAGGDEEIQDYDGSGIA